MIPLTVDLYFDSLPAPAVTDGAGGVWLPFWPVAFLMALICLPLVVNWVIALYYFGEYLLCKLTSLMPAVSSGSRRMFARGSHGTATVPPSASSSPSHGVTGWDQAAIVTELVGPEIDAYKALLARMTKLPVGSKIRGRVELWFYQWSNASSVDGLFPGPDVTLPLLLEVRLHLGEITRERAATLIDRLQPRTT